MADNHKDVLVELADTQGSEEDMRKYVNERDLFLNKRDGQWEPKILQNWSSRPKYTFDQCNPVVDNIMGEMEQTDFAVNVKPNGGGASKEMAMNYAGMVRNIENISKGRRVYNQAARKMVGTGLGGWRVVQKYKDDDCFDQDLMIESLANFQDRVWFDQDAVEQDMSDSIKCWVLTSLSMAEYEKRFPKGSRISVSENKDGQAYDKKKNHEVIICEFYKRTRKERDLARMSDGSVFVVNDDFNKIYDELQASGITIEDTRTRYVHETKHRLMDGGDFLTGWNDTVFNHIPVVPVYANFDLSENKIVYWGAIEKLMDPQRVLNYAESKKTAESSLKPVEKTWVAKEQAESTDVKNTLASQNTNSDPIQFYDHADGVVPPFKPQVNQPDSVLIETAASAQNYLNASSGLYNPSRGKSDPNQSADTVKLLQNKGDSSNYKYFGAMEVALTHTGTILLEAIPKVYTGEQVTNIIGEDGSSSEITINRKIFDKETQKPVVINDLSQGSFSFTCSSGPAFKNRQQETVTNILEVGKVLPDVLEKGKDVLLSNISAPGMDKVAARIRLDMVKQGAIPPDQMTDEEKAMMQQLNAQGQQPTPTEQAQIGLAQAEIKKADAQTADVMSKMQERQAKAVQAQEQNNLKLQQMMLDYQTTQEKRMDEKEKSQTELILGLANQLKTHTETLKNLKDVLGADAIVGPGITKTFTEQVDIVNETQDNQ